MPSSAPSTWADWRLKIDAIARSEGDASDVNEAQNLIDKAWAAGTVGYRRPLKAEEEDSSIYIKLSRLIKRIIESNDRDRLLNQIFTTPRNTGVLLLGFCSLLQWRYESYILKLLKILHDLKCGGVNLAVVASRGAPSTAPTTRRRRPATNTDGVQNDSKREEDDGATSVSGLSTIDEPPGALMDRSWSNNIDLMADFSSFLQGLETNQEALQSQLALDPHLQRTQTFRLDDLDAEDEELADSVPLVMDDEDESSFFALTGSNMSQSATLIGGDLKATTDLSLPSAHVANEEPPLYTSPPIPSLNLESRRHLSPDLDAQVIVDSDLGTAEASSDATELVTMRHAEAPSARVRRRDSIVDHEEASVLKEAGKAENRRVLKQPPAKDGIGLFPSKRLGSLFVLEDKGPITREGTDEEALNDYPPYIIRSLGRTFDWRAKTEIPELWRGHIKKLSTSLEERYRIMISNALLNTYFEAAANNRSATDSLYSSDYFNDDWRNEPIFADPDPIEDQHDLTRSRASSDRRSARFGLSGSSLASSSNRVDMATPCLSLDEGTGSLSKMCEETICHTTNELSIQPFDSTVATPLGEIGPTQIEMSPDELEQTNRTVSQAEARYNPLTWQMLCVIRNNIRKRAEALAQPPDTTYICFHDLVPPHKCRKSNATQAIYQILLLLTLNELTCHQEVAFGSIKIMLGPGPLGTSSTALTSTTGTWSSEDAGLLQTLDQFPRATPVPPPRPALPPAPKAGDERKRSRSMRVSVRRELEGSDLTASSSSPSQSDENDGMPNVVSQGDVVRSKRRRIQNS